jgi:outer membrane lipoprotein-sorting protein
MIKTLLSAALVLLLSGPALGATISPDETDARKIMTAVEDRDEGDRGSSKITMTITDDAGRKRVRVIRSRAMTFDGGNKQLMIFEAPADVRNTGLLSVDYDDGAKNDDQWLYLPSLRKTTRISSGDRSGSFMGSDLTYADMTRADPDDYDYSVVKADATVGGEACWLIEARPKTEKAKNETGYIKSQLWVSKSKLMPLQAKMWIKKGKRIKQLRFAGVKKVDGIWIATKLSARTLRGGKVESTTVLAFDAMKFNDPTVKAADFSQRRLEQGL